MLIRRVLRNPIAGPKADGIPAFRRSYVRICPPCRATPKRKATPQGGLSVLQEIALKGVAFGAASP